MTPSGSEPPRAPIDVDGAVDRIRGHVRRTPVIDVDGVTLKLELFQHAGSFKVRGAFNQALVEPLPEAGLIAASGGNHGIAVAHVARVLGVRAEVFVPRVASSVKVERLRAQGAVVHVVGELYDDAQVACDGRAAETGARNIHPYDSPITVAGQATMGVELHEQCPELDTVIVAVGGGGLAAGLVASLPSAVRVVCVEPRRSCCFNAALAVGGPVRVDVAGVAADSLGAKQVGDVPWELLRDRAESVLVTDDAIDGARRRLWDDVGILAEHGGAAAFAALVSGAYVPGPGERVAVVVCGSNTDPGDLALPTDLRSPRVR